MSATKIIIASAGTLAVAALATLATLLGIFATMEVISRDQLAELKMKEVLYEESLADQRVLEADYQALEHRSMEMLSTIEELKQQVDQLTQELYSAYSYIKWEMPPPQESREERQPVITFDSRFQNKTGPNAP